MPPAVATMPEGPIPVAARPAVVANTFSRPVIAVAVPGTLRVELRASRCLDKLNFHAMRRGGGQEREVTELRLEQNGCGVAAGRAAERRP